MTLRFMTREMSGLIAERGKGTTGLGERVVLRDLFWLSSILAVY